MASRANELLRSGKKIVCVGRSFAKHAKEMGESLPTEPLLFIKPTTSVLPQGQPLQIPKGVSDVHHEVELGVVIGKSTAGQPIASSNAMDHVAGYTLALDMTARCVQAKAKAAGNPWSVSKGYDGFCPMSEAIDSLPDIGNTRLWCAVDGEMKQDGTTADMIWDVPALLSHISTIFTLEPGDVVLTGTPDGVGPVRAGETLRAGLECGGVTLGLEVPVTQRSF